MSIPSKTRSFDEPFDAVLARVPEALAAEGFGVLTEIDVRATFKKKLDTEFRDYRILGACNPKLAHRALGTDLDVGVLLPCNVVVRAEDDGRTTVAIVDPMSAMVAAGDEALSDVASEAAARLDRVLQAL